MFYFVFYFAITKFDLKTPGREDDDEESEKKVVLANNNYTDVASAVLAAVGETARALGLLGRRQNDWRAVEELTDALRAFDAEDPARGTIFRCSAQAWTAI